MTDGKEKAGLQWSLLQTRDSIRSFWGNRIGTTATVYLAACLEYIAAEILELSGNAARDDQSTEILPKHITLAIKRDDELRQLFRMATFAGLSPPKSGGSTSPGGNYCTREERGQELPVPESLPVEVVHHLLNNTGSITACPSLVVKDAIDEVANSEW